MASGERRLPPGKPAASQATDRRPPVELRFPHFSTISPFARWIPGGVSNVSGCPETSCRVRTTPSETLWKIVEIVANHVSNRVAFRVENFAAFRVTFRVGKRVASRASRRAACIGARKCRSTPISSMRTSDRCPLYGNMIDSPRDARTPTTATACRYSIRLFTLFRKLGCVPKSPVPRDGEPPKQAILYGGRSPPIISNFC
jgi:hypothetical protein